MPSNTHAILACFAMAAGCLPSYDPEFDPASSTAASDGSTSSGAGEDSDKVDVGVGESTTSAEPDTGPDPMGTVVCGDGVPESPEICDDGNLNAGDGCSADCMSDETCGNGVVDVATGEQCDDNGQAVGDGCGPRCLFEDGRVATFSFIDTDADDITDSALSTFFEGLTVERGDFFFFEVVAPQGNGDERPGAWCAERADWYVSSYLTHAPTTSSIGSGAWSRWARNHGDRWSEAYTAGVTNHFGEACAGPLSWCSEWNVDAADGTNIANQIHPQSVDTETMAGVPKPPGVEWTLTIRIAPSRLVACGF